EPIDYVGLNLVDFRLEVLDSQWSSMDRSWMESNREFLTPLLNFKNAGGQESFAKKLQDAIKPQHVNEVEGLQILYFVNQNNADEDVVNFSEEVIDAYIDNVITDTQFNGLLENPFFIFTPDIPINNIREYLSCFDISKGAELTIFVDQPLNNRHDPFSAAGDKAGHAFIGIRQGNVQRYFGLYPNGSATPFDTNHPNIFGNNQGDEFNVSITFQIDKNSLSSIIDNAVNYNQNYDLNDNNCTDFVLEVASICQFALPDPQSTWFNGGGSNPGAFGQAIRSMDLPNGMIRNVNRGNANNNSGTCN
ncbi:hypothetical protein U6A24_18075, partial [Aquimarina gracilis]|nr:hypothetical protein [Aquimarina gracilis]